MPSDGKRSDCRLLQGQRPEAEFLDEIQQKSEEFSFLLFRITYSFALRFIFLQTHATSYIFYSALLYTVKKKGEKTSYGLRNPYRNLNSENSQDYQRNCSFMNSASVHMVLSAPAVNLKAAALRKDNEKFRTKTQDQ
jgi:hypothetical protein